MQSHILRVHVYLAVAEGEKLDKKQTNKNSHADRRSLFASGEIVFSGYTFHLTRLPGRVLL